MHNILDKGLTNRTGSNDSDNLGFLKLENTQRAQTSSRSVQNSIISYQNGF